MKKIALILAVVMMLSAVSVYAAPSVEHIFYDEVANKYYVFGTYQNSVINGRAVNAEELGLIVNDGEIEKTFTYKDLEAQNEKGDTKFGMSFGVPEELSTFKVTPYSVNDVKTEYGIEREWDAVNDRRKLSSDATLKYVSFSRPEMSNTQFIIYPAFDPNHFTYKVKGYYRDNNAYQAPNLIDIKYMLSDPKATAVCVPSTTVSGSTTITVTSEDETQTNTYTFTYENKSVTANATNHVYKSSLAGVFYQGENVTTSTSDIRNTYYLSISSYPLSVDKKRLYVEFPVTEALASQNAIGFSFSGKSATTPYVEYKNVEVSIKKATLKEGYKLDIDSTCYQDILDGNIIIGDEVARLGIASFDNSTARRYTVDVTDAIKKAYQNGETSIVFELSIADYDLPENASATNICFDIMCTHSTDARNPQLVY